jgi:Skp family chaperone for outer membrane proteins
MFNRSLLALAALTLATSAVFAQNAPAPGPTPTPAPAGKTVDQREASEQARIKEGKQSGALTKKEAHRLQAEQRAVKHEEKKAGADGVVTAQEQKKLDRMQNKESRDIRRQKHDKQTRAASAPSS